MSYDLADLERRLSNIIRFGHVSETDLAESPPQVRVELDDGAPTDWLPWVTTRAGRTKHWSPPDIGESVVILSPSGELAQGRVLPGCFYDAFLANGADQDLDRVTYPDGSVIEYDSAAHHLTVTVGAGHVTVNCADCTVNAETVVQLNTPDTNLSGNLTVDGRITGKDGISVFQTSGGGGPTAEFTGTMQVVGGDVLADAVSLKGHHHIEHDGPPTSAAVA